MIPFIDLFGVHIPMYGLCAAMGILAAGTLALRRGKREGCDVNDLIALMACAAAGGLVGAKGLYILSSYGIDAAAASLARGDFSFIAGSGLVFYGGLLGGAASALVSSHFLGQSPEKLCKAIVPTVPLGHAFGRLGCFCAGCCYGLAYNGPLAVQTPYAPGGHFPAQLMEAALNLLLSAILLHIARRSKGLSLLRLYLVLYAVERFMLEYLRGDTIRGSVGVLSTSQLISVLVICGVLLCQFFGKNRKTAFLRALHGPWRR